jgi:hypothetical protein
MTEIRKVDYWYVTVPHKPGEGARILEALRDEGVNLLAFHAFPDGRRAQIDLVPADSAELKAAASKAGLDLTQRKRAFIVESDDRIGALGDVARRLADADINITALDAVTAGSGRFGALFWVASDDYNRAAEVLDAR